MRSGSDPQHGGCVALPPVYPIHSEGAGFVRTDTLYRHARLEERKKYERIETMTCRKPLYERVSVVFLFIDLCKIPR